MPQGPTKMQTAQRLNSTPRGGALHQTKVPPVYVPDVPSSFFKITLRNARILPPEFPVFPYAAG